MQLGRQLPNQRRDVDQPTAAVLRDLHATLQHCLGIYHDRLACRLRWLDSKLTGVEPADVVGAVLV
jgi:hypothetical protein